MRLFSTRVAAICGLAFALTVTGCGKKDEEKDDEEEAADPNAPGGTGGGAADTVTVAGKLTVGAALSLAPVLTDLKLFCVTFEETTRSATSEFAADGGFSVTLPKNVNFGCFVNNKATNIPVASFVIAPEGGFGGGSTSIALSGSVDLGALVLGDDGKVSIPASALVGFAATSSTSIDVDQLHGHTFNMECQDTGNAESYASCLESLTDGESGKPMTVFLRILKGTQAGKDIFGMGVWQDKPSFEACGSVDMSAAKQAKLAEDDVTLTQVAIGAFTDGEGCPKREDGDHGGEGEGDDEGRPEGNFAISELVPNGSGYSFRDHSSGSSGSCTYEHSTAIEFTGTSDVMFGAFTSSDQKMGDCGGDAEDQFAAFNVKFTKVD